MDIEMVLNELSLQLASNVWAARQRMALFLDTVAAARKCGIDPLLRAQEDLFVLTLSPDYPVSKWYNDSQVDHDLRLLFGQMTSVTPLLEGLEHEPLYETIVLSDPFFEEERALGLGVAFWLEALAISMPSEPRWQNSHLQIQMSQLDQAGELFQTIEEVHHASFPEHVEEHLAWIAQRIQSGQAPIRSGGDLIGQKERLFPHLQFCASALEQLRALLTGDLQILSIQKKLQDLEKYCTEWFEGPFDPQKLVGKVSPESQATLGAYAATRTFLCPDGEARLFSWHLRLTPGSWRIYFHPIGPEMMIGYIGSHLPTVEYPT